MSFLRRLFPKRTPRTVNDPVFGKLSYSSHGGGVWSNDASHILGTPLFQLLVNADEKGPTNRQRQEFRTLLAERDRRFEQLRAVVRRARAERGLPDAMVEVEAIAVPPFDDAIGDAVWRIWFATQDESEELTFGVETRDWTSFIPFAED